MNPPGLSQSHMEPPHLWGLRSKATRECLPDLHRALTSANNLAGGRICHLAPGRCQGFMSAGARRSDGDWRILEHG